MRTYTLEIDGKPYEAFRAKDDDDAAEWAYSQQIWREDCRKITPVGFAMVTMPEGKITARPATIPEQARWRKRATEFLEFDTESAEDESDLAALDADSYMVKL